MKKTVLCLVVIALAAMTAAARDMSTVTINGGHTSVVMHPTLKQHNVKIHPAVNPFYDNIGTSGYQAGIGWTISDGSPINTEYTPGNQFVSLRSGTTHKISVGVGWVLTASSTARVTLDKDCAGVPCGTIDKTKLCRGTIKNMAQFGQSSTQVESFHCKAKLAKGKPYWVYVESMANDWLAWNFSNSATGGLIEGTDDVWGSPSSGQPVGALTVQ